MGRNKESVKDAGLGKPLAAASTRLTDGNGTGWIFQVSRPVGTGHDTRRRGEEETEKEGKSGRYVGNHLRENDEIQMEKFYEITFIAPSAPASFSFSLSFSFFFFFLFFFFGAEPTKMKRYTG